MARRRKPVSPGEMPSEEFLKPLGMGNDGVQPPAAPASISTTTGA
jgi:CubicO group peptidase (beta-lactamase class C family)